MTAPETSRQEWQSADVGGPGQPQRLPEGVQRTRGGAPGSEQYCGLEQQSSRDVPDERGAPSSCARITSISSSVYSASSVSDSRMRRVAPAAHQRSVRPPRFCAEPPFIDAEHPHARALRQGRPGVRASAVTRKRA